MKEYTVNLSDTAQRGLREIYDYLLSRTLHAAFSDSFIMELRRYLESLSHFPERFPIYMGNIRRAVYPENKNYLIFFEINEDSAEVFVLDVVNASRYTRYKDLA
uniref:ParE toxin of type II toxin-antitoxin system, parDE n=1 Tax=Candidatus Kentrum sp. DK TaxID=2126562 RepID=A0A450SUQ6_9GAMM|nr:MAG: ParE toxin of type II toxin-antitoxin system, parDE [Candidatus Kentron sp. DK]